MNTMTRFHGRDDLLGRILAVALLGSLLLASVACGGGGGGGLALADPPVDGTGDDPPESGGGEGAVWNKFDWNDQPWQ